MKDYDQVPFNRFGKYRAFGVTRLISNNEWLRPRTGEFHFIQWGFGVIDVSVCAIAAPKNEIHISCIIKECISHPGFLYGRKKDVDGRRPA
jgi:hypothetical protein